MSASDAIRAQGKIIETVGHDAYRVELPNGHRAVGRVAKGTQATSIKIGDHVSIEFHPYDLSRGWINPA